MNAYSMDLRQRADDDATLEELFSKLKVYLRKVKARTIEALRDAIGEGLRTVSASDIDGWFKSCGYRHTQT